MHINNKMLNSISFRFQIFYQEQEAIFAEMNETQFSGR